MTRELRLKCAALLFYITLAGSLFVTDKGINLLNDLPKSADWTKTLIALLGAGILVFTSDAVGYLFNSVAFFTWNARGKMGPGFGYANEWDKLSYDLKNETIKPSSITSSSDSQGWKHPLFEERWGNFSPDIFLSYFWQQAPRVLVEWVSRRHTAFFMGRSAALAIGSGMFISIAVISLSKMGWTIWHICIGLFWIGMIIVIQRNSRAAKEEAWQMIDLWLASAFNPKVHRTLEDIMAYFSGKEGETIRRACYKVIRADEVNTRENQSDRRLYYCDPDVDIVVTTISKRHIEDAHRHVTNTEIYYVVHGRLSVKVEGQSVSLKKGDLIIVYPGACHSFETDNEEVCFLAIKKQPLLKDKESC